MSNALCLIIVPPQLIGRRFEAMEVDEKLALEVLHSDQGGGVAKAKTGSGHSSSILRRQDLSWADVSARGHIQQLIRVRW